MEGFSQRFQHFVLHWFSTSTADIQGLLKTFLAHWIIVDVVEGPSEQFSIAIRTCEAILMVGLLHGCASGAFYGEFFTALGANIIRHG